MNTKMILVAIFSAFALIATSASAHNCKLPETNAKCQGKTIKNKMCKVMLSKEDCKKAGGKHTK